MTVQIAFDTSYARLPPRFYVRQEPARVAGPRLVKLNVPLAEELGLDPVMLAAPPGVAILAGNEVPPGAASIALAYAGHQFGHFMPQLGDGRAILLGEVVDRAGRRRDIQLKGSGRTPFSRGGDGRAALGPVLREYLVSEAMAALGIPTTRSLAAVMTGEPVFRESALPGAVLTRVAASHIRVGTFQYFAARQDTDALRLLADHAIARHDPSAAEAAHPYRAFLDGVIARQAELVARWLLVGFVHGVMNTDNTSISGETIDYGPCAFIDTYDPAAVYSSIDHAGRYAYANQPAIAHWNLTRLAEAILPLLAEDTDAAVAIAKECLSAFRPRFERVYTAGMLRKIGLDPDQTEDGDALLAQTLLDTMHANLADFTNTFRGLAGCVESPAADSTLRALFSDSAAFDAWAVDWRARLSRDGRDPAERAAAMRAVNPAFIPRNHRVEYALASAVNGQGFEAFETLLSVLSRPFEDQPLHTAYAAPPEAHEIVRATFCGT